MASAAVNGLKDSPSGLGCELFNYLFLYLVM